MSKLPHRYEEAGRDVGMELRLYDISLAIPLGFPFPSWTLTASRGAQLGRPLSSRTSRQRGRGSVGQYRPRRRRSSSLTPPWSALRWGAMGGSRREGCNEQNRDGLITPTPETISASPTSGPGLQRSVREPVSSTDTCSTKRFGLTVEPRAVVRSEQPTRVDLQQKRANGQGREADNRARPSTAPDTTAEQGGGAGASLA
ncbi:hypothetical protein B296_00034816 [Ensete ventricosum]|uniref:Uncharacterized protein n=1 Tax=Ensete ventricosum TaxID=4639 RepID=A0A426Y4E6_ENSVE|nr:hypothetical protein B296_00034816 [Ensete ventricosum]